MRLTWGLAKVGLKEYGLNIISLIINKTWAEAEVTQNTQPSPSLSRWLQPFLDRALKLRQDKMQKLLIVFIQLSVDKTLLIWDFCVVGKMQIWFFIDKSFAWQNVFKRNKLIWFFKFCNRFFWCNCFCKLIFFKVFLLANTFLKNNNLKSSFLLQQLQGNRNLNSINENCLTNCLFSDRNSKKWFCFFISFIWTNYVNFINTYCRT